MKAKILEFIKTTCKEKRNKGDYPYSASLCLIANHLNVDKRSIKPILKELIKMDGVSYYMGLNDVYFSTKKPVQN